MIAAARLPLLDLLDAYQLEALLGRSPRTFEAYRQAIRLLQRSLDRTVFADELSKPLLSEFRAARHAAGKSPATVNKDLRHLAALWQFAWDESLTPEPPRKTRPLAQPKREPVAWSLPELSAQLAMAGQLPGTVGLIPRDIFWPALLLTVYDSGGRIGAVMQARAEDCDVDRRILLLRAEHQKQRADQAIRLSPQTCQLLARLLEYFEAALFPWPFDRTGNYRILRKHYRKQILEPAKLPTTRRDLFHKLRRTTATFHADAAGEAAAQFQLGHSSASVTRGYLDRSKMKSVSQASDHLPRPELPAIASLQGDHQRRLF